MVGSGFTRRVLNEVLSLNAQESASGIDLMQQIASSMKS